MINFSIPLPPVTKKNHQQIRINCKTGKPFVAQSDAYRAYEQAALWFLKPLGIDYPVNVRAVYFMKTKRRVDLANLHAALHDVLVKAGTLQDDHCGIVASTDGSRVAYDKANPRTEVTITPLPDMKDEGKFT